MKHLQLMDSQKALLFSWCSGLRMALLCCCNTLPPNCHTPYSAAQGPLVQDKGPDWGRFDTSAFNHQSILIAPSWWTNGSQKGCPNHKSDYRGDSTQNRWIVLGFAMQAASLVSLSHTTLFYYLVASQTDALPDILPSPTCAFFFPKSSCLDPAMNCFQSHLLV